MIFDTRTTFANAVSVAAAAGTALIGNQIDLGSSNTCDVDDLYLVIMVTTGIVTGGSAGKIRFQLASGSSAAIAVDGTAAVHSQTGDFVTGSTAIPAGTCLAVFELPKGTGVLPTINRFLGLLCVTTTTTTTAGAITAFLSTETGRWAALPNATN